MVTNKGLRVVAILEASKGLLSLAVGFGVHVLAGKNIAQLAESLVSHAHLNPASRLPHAFIHAAGSITDANLLFVAIGALLYACVRLIEAYGLWHGQRWTEWFALVSGAIYLPIELYELIIHRDLLGVAVLAINIIIVWYMAKVLFHKRDSAL